MRDWISPRPVTRFIFVQVIFAQGVPHLSLFRGASFLI
jgi:hypothetical protein